MMYSQNLEEQIILNYFKGQTGTFLDAGSNDGRTFSNTLALVERGWRGSCIEASPKAFERLKKEHEGKGIELNNIALASYDGEIVLHESGELIGKGDVALVSSTMDAELLRWESMKIDFEKIKVPCLTFQSFLRLSTYKTFDFISIDIEGMELEILPQMDFGKLKTKMVCVEWNSKNGLEYSKILVPFGFRLIHKNLENLIYAR
jgi:FkbM family methyltransferase